MTKKKKLKLNKLTIQNFVHLEDAEAQNVKGGTRYTICNKTCGTECTVQLTFYCTYDNC